MSPTKPENQLSTIIKEKAYELGFDACGFSKATFLKKETIRYKAYLDKGFQGKMKYLEENLDKKFDPQKLLDNSKSVISLLLNYFQPKKQNPESKYKITKYAYGKDYHKVLKGKMKALVNFIKEYHQEVNARYFVDSGPVLDKAWAAKSGLGWIGKNTLLLNEKLGSYTFIGDIILDIELDYDSPKKDQCGNCTKCIEACPTKAIIEPYKLNAGKCISYQTTSGSYNPSTDPKINPNNWIWGCDICQDVCPWNRDIKAHNEADFAINKIIEKYSSSDWEQLSEEVFIENFSDSSIGERKFARIKYNIEIVSEFKKKLPSD